MSLSSISAARTLLSSHRGGGNVSRVSDQSGQDDAEMLTTFKRTLLVAALETPPRYRSDLDLVMIRQHLASLGVFASVPLQIFHYLATECIISVSTCFMLGVVGVLTHQLFMQQRVPDGEVLFYQEDVVDDYSLAYIVVRTVLRISCAHDKWSFADCGLSIDTKLEGSLCGYFNKGFSQRISKGDDFRAWNSKKNNARGVAIDFGDLQVTYGKGAMCGVEDFHLAASSPTHRKNNHHNKAICRHKSVHSQEPTIIIGLPKDTFERASERFGLTYEKGVITSTKTLRSDVAHLAIFSQLSDTAARSILQSASKRQLEAGEVLFAPESKKDYNTNSEGFAYVRHGRLDIYCAENDKPRQQRVVSPSDLSMEQVAAATTATSNDRDVVIPKDALASLTRGQTFGDQMIALGHPHIWVSNPRRPRQTNVRFKVVAGDASTEVIWITRDQFEQHARDDQLRLSYNPIFAKPYPTDAGSNLVSIVETGNICQITRQLLTNAKLSKFFVQFPPLVLERLCHHMEVQRHESSNVLLNAGDPIQHVSVVVSGALHTHHSRSDGDTSTVKTTKRVSLTQDINFVPGDAFGARELLKHNAFCDAPVLAVAGTTMLCIARSAFERWVVPMRHNIIVKAGSILQPLLWSSSSSPTSSRPTYTNKYTSLVKMNRRQSGPSAFSATLTTTEPDRKKMRGLDEAAILLKRLDLFQTLPRFLLAQMLGQANLITKTAGDLLFREGDTERALVVLLSGFVSFYSLEHMSATVDMFQKHSFCIYCPFFGSTINPDDYLPEPRGDEVGDSSPSSVVKLCGAMHGVHVQTLSSRNAFRTGVLQEGTVCPATVVAQTDCEYLVFDENMYSRLLTEHIPVVDMRNYGVPLTAEKETGPQSTSVSSSSSEPRPLSPQSSSGPITTSKDYRQGVIPPQLLAHLEAARIPWLPPNSAKKTLLLRSMQHVVLAPGQRLIQCNETIKQIVFVVSGKLAVYVRESYEVSSVLNASQRSVESAALERSVASNFSTTSQQLYQERLDSSGTTNRNVLRRKIARISEMEAVENDSEPPRPGRSTFTNFVMQAAREVKSRQVSQPDNSQEEAQEQSIPVSPAATRRSLHTMVNKVSFQRSQNASSSATRHKETSKALIMFYLGPGDIYGDEITAPSGVFRSVHDVYADTSIPSSPEIGLNGMHVSPAGTEVLCLDRYIMQGILAKTEEDAANELLGRSSSAKSKWQIASKKLFKRASDASIEEPGGFLKAKKTPKLFDFFKNILNQRRFLTMGTIAQFPQLRELPEDARRDLCLNARFEALDRYTDAYKSSGDGNTSGLRFFLLLSGHINLVANGPSSHIMAQSSTTSGFDYFLRGVGAGEGFGEFEILVPDAPAHIAAIAAEPTKLLSIPADMFLKHWPFTGEARGNIEYLRTRIPCFTSLDLERIAYLYHSFSFQTHVRGTNIFQVREGKEALERPKELYLVKDGTCSIRQCITLVSRLESDSRYFPCEGDCSTEDIRPTSVSAKKPIRSIKVLATVADVSVGHVFWIDNDYHPITLVASSASVTIASISIDRLKAIVPRGLLVALEKLSEQLHDLYAQQFKLAKRAAATVLNEKEGIQAPESDSTGRLPTLQSRTPQSAQARDGNDDADNRVAYEKARRTKMINVIYDDQHQIERYEAPSTFPVSALIGSFLEKNDIPLDTLSDDGRPLNSIATNQSKHDETRMPEHTAGCGSTHRTETTSMVHLNVKIPLVGRVGDDITTPAAQISFPVVQVPSTQWRSSSSFKRSDRKIVEASKGAEVTAFEKDGILSYEIDVRARVHALMCTIASPMRTIRLEPSHTPVNTLGKYYFDSPSPFAKPGSTVRQRLALKWQQESPVTVKPATKAATIHAAGPFRPKAKLLRASAFDPPRPALTRKQGFLTALRISNAVPLYGDESVLLDGILPRIHQGRRFFYTLIDIELREYADSIALSHLAQTPFLRSYNLQNPCRPCIVSDVPVTPGGAEALLRLSFLVIVDDTTQLFFTASSAIDKQKWMTELNQARTLGGLQHAVTVKVQSPRPIAPKRPPADPTLLATAVIDAFRGSRRSTIQERRRSSTHVSIPKPADEALLVEFRIS